MSIEQEYDTRPCANVFDPQDLCDPSAGPGPYPGLFDDQPAFPDQSQVIGGGAPSLTQPWTMVSERYWGGDDGLDWDI